MISIIKTNSQLNKLRECGRIVGVVHRRVLKSIKVGVTTSYLNELSEVIIAEEGGIPAFKGYKGFPYCTCISVNNTIVHGFPCEYELLEGDVVSFDVGVLKNKYFGDAAFTTIVGKSINKQDVLLVNTTKLCLDKAINILKEGTTVGDLGEVIEETARSKGFDVVRNYIGHGIGKELHEKPSIFNYGEKGMGEVLKAGMVICIEPMLVKDDADNITSGWEVKTKNGNNAAHFEHQIIIHKDYAEVITNSL